MEFSEDEYYKPNYILLSVVGLWPYDNFKVRQFHFFLSLLISLSFEVAQLIKLIVLQSDLGAFLKTLSSFMNFLVIFTKYITFYAVLKNIKKFRERIRNNWGFLNDNREIEIMHKQAHAGKLFTIGLSIFAYFIIFCCISTQYFSTLLDILKPLNESRPRKLIFMAEYFVDQEKYFYIISVHLSVGLFVFITMLLATESFCFVTALHAFSLFKVASYRMEHILNETDQQMCPTKKFVIFRSRLIAAVDFHRRALELVHCLSKLYQTNNARFFYFKSVIAYIVITSISNLLQIALKLCNLLQASFGSAYLMVFLIIVISASIALYNISQVLMTDDVLEIMIYISFIIMSLIYLTVGNFVGQEFIDCDMHLHRTICNTPWYNASLKAQNMIFFLMQKTTKCYKVAAGGMFAPSLEGLATSLSMMISYFMVLHSTQS